MFKAAPGRNSKKKKGHMFRPAQFYWFEGARGLFLLPLFCIRFSTKVDQNTARPNYQACFHDNWQVTFLPQAFQVMNFCDKNPQSPSLDYQHCHLCWALPLKACGEELGWSLPITRSSLEASILTTWIQVLMVDCLKWFAHLLTPTRIFVIYKSWSWSAVIPLSVFTLELKVILGLHLVSHLWHCGDHIAIPNWCSEK